MSSAITGERGRHSFLIVDDEPDVLESLRHLFHRRYRVLTAQSGPEALEVLGRDDVHIILSDQRMPGMTGDELLRRAREVAPDAVRLLFTGYADIQAVIAAVNHGGIFRYIHKPWEPAELDSIVRQAAAQYDLLEERRRLVADLRASNQGLSTANRELAESDQLKNAFLEVASHEFKTPITIIQGLSDLLCLINPARDADEREILDQLSDSSRKLTRLVDNTLRLLEAGGWRDPLQVEPIDAAALIKGAVEPLLPFAHARRLDLRVDIAEGLGSFELDADKVRDALIHILTNAIKFTPDGGRIDLTARADPDGPLRVEVHDRGIGLEPRALNRLFEPFFTEFDPSHHSSGSFGFGKRGLGIGLSIAKKFIDLHGGRVEAESTLGAGTRIAVEVPRCPCPSADSAVQFGDSSASGLRGTDSPPPP